jgi:D-alanyl-D-alanine carboxypeptidase
MWRIVFLLCLMSLFSCAVLNDQPEIEDAVFTSELTAALQTELESLNQSLDNYGMSASLYISDRCYWEAAAGVTQQDASVPVEPDMLFNFASITKTFVAAIVLQLVEEQKISLDDPLGKWIAPHANIDPNVTIRQLLNHGSGFANYFNGDFYWAELKPDPDRLWLPEELLEFVGPPRSLGFSSPAYSNTNYLLLGIIIEAATGNAFENELRIRITDPLNLEYTHLPNVDFEPERWANSSFLVSSVYSSVWTAGAIVSTSREIAKFFQVLNSGEFLQTATLETMRETEHRYVGSGGFQMGLGIWEIQVDYETAWGHGGHLHPFLSRAFFLPKYNLSIAYSSSGEELNRQGLPGRHLLETYIEHLPEDISMCFDS